jgi:hypothetical protein
MNVSQTDEPVCRQYVIQLCDPCIAAEGQECHTPGCALWLHSVDLPIHREVLTEVEYDYKLNHWTEILQPELKKEYPEWEVDSHKCV